MSQNNPKDVSEEMKLNPVSNLSEIDLKENKKAVEEEGGEEEGGEEEGGEEEGREDLKEVVKDIKKTSVVLRLGDVIVIQSATNEILNNNTFLIEYIDREKIKMVNADTFDKAQLRINKNGVIGDGSITKINIISSNPNRGYARQHDLITGKWINIYFGGDVPLIITGQITDLEEDMIEVKTMDDETIYINFEYHGIPEDLPIQAFEIRPPPETKGQVEVEEEEEELKGEEGLKGIDEFENEDFGDEGSEEGEIREVKGFNEKIQIPVKNVKKNVQRLIFNADDVVFGEIMHVQEHVEIDQDKYRFNIETQTNDLLEEMLSSIPSAKRTANVLNRIHIMISRFIQLRDISSNFDKNKNVTGFIQKTAIDRPLANYLSDFKNNLYWIMMVAKNVKKTYVLDAAGLYERINDIEVIPENTNLLEMSSLFKRYKSNEGIEGQNKYSGLYSALNPYLTPFSSDNLENASAFNSENRVIIEGRVNSNINAIIDNLGDFQSTIVTRGQETSRKFVIQKYNLGLNKLHVENGIFKGPRMDAQRINLTNNDEIAITSIITLPEPTVQFSQINLPGSSLLVKSNLNLHFLNYWQLLKQQSNISSIEIDGLDNELEFNDGNFVDNIKNYTLNLSDFEMPGGVQLTKLEVYNKFLKIIIPKIIILFNLVKKYIKGKLSMSNLISYLEPFMIYPDDLTYMNYKELDKFIKDKIREYNSRYVEYSRAFSAIKSIRSPKTLSAPIFETLNNEPTIKISVFEAYDYIFSQELYVSSSEFLKKTILADYGNLYNTAVAFSNLALVYPVELNPLFEADKDTMKTSLEKALNKDSCTSYVIAKKYFTRENLTNDNDKIIYFDREYDTTDYDMINQQFAKERDTLTPDELEIYITEQLKKKYKKEERDAMYLAETLVNQAKKVIDGQYAIISVEPQVAENLAELEYYIRQDNTWTKAEEVDPKWFIQDPDILCNINPSCIYNAKKTPEDACESMTVSKETMVSSALKDVMKEFDKNYKISKNELTTYVQKHLNYFEDIIVRLQDLNLNTFYKYNNQKYNLGLSISEKGLEQKVSPYMKICNLIVGQSDFVKQQTDIGVFAHKFCRPGDPSIANVNDGEMENIWWFYCKETDTKLIPAFRVLLARIFVRNPSKYDANMENIIKMIGKLGDNGDAWVDEHSGEVIRYIDFDISDGYKGGFKDINRSIMERDSNDVSIEEHNERKTKKEIRLSPEGQLVSNIIVSITSNMGINLDKSYDYIIKVVTELMGDVKVIEKEAAYKEREKEAAKKGKKLPEYMLVYSSTLLYLSLGMILIAIQTSIPSVRTRKTFPGCVRSFNGFPLEGEGDDSGLNYLACIAYKYKNPHTIPWNAISKTNIEKMTTILKSFIIKYLLSYSVVDQRIKDKVDYLLLNPEKNDIPTEHSLTHWTNFLPPLKQFHIKKLENISEGFVEDLKSDLTSGNSNQFDKLLVIQSKITQFSLAIQEDIQKIVENKDLLMKASGQPFMINACCNEGDHDALTALQYFIKENPNIDINNKIVRELTSLLRSSNKLSESAIMLSEVNTKRLFPGISNDFSDEIIYRAFISLCNFQSSIPLTSDLLAICVDKPNYLSKTDSIQEKISKLKRDERHYTKEMFLRLFQIVSRHNIINISLSYTTPSCSELLRRLLVKMDDDDEQTVAKALRQKMDALLDTFDMSLKEDTEDMKHLKNYLAKSNDNMRKEIISFIKRKAKIGGSELKKLTTFLENISVWQVDINRRNDDIKISDDAMYNYINFNKNFITLFSTVFPTMILNKKEPSFTPHAYWNFAQSHVIELKDDVESYLVGLEKFFNNNAVGNVVLEVQEKCKGILLLAQVTPVLTNTKVADQELYNVFDKRTTTLLYEYYILQVFTEYINLTKDPVMASQMLKPIKTGDPSLYSSDFLVEQQLKFAETEDIFIEGNVDKLQEDTAKLLATYLTIMMRSKKSIDISYDKVDDIIFKLKEAEKYTFTDRLRDLDDEQREVENVLKIYKLGVWSTGLSKGIREYDPENYEHEKAVSQRIAEIQNGLRKNGAIDENMDLELNDALEDMEAENFADADELQMGDIGEDYDNGDPYNEENED
jgi:septum formation topological specificity factor MinE